MQTKSYRVLKLPIDFFNNILHALKFTKHRIFTEFISKAKNSSCLS